MANDWRTVRLDELFEFSSGLSKPRSEFGFGRGFLTFKDVLDNYFVPNELSALVNSTHKEQAKCSIRRGDIFLTRTSETQPDLGMSCVALRDYPGATFNGFTKRLRPKTPNAVVPEYSAYYFRSPQFRQAVTSLSSLSTRASLNNEMLSRLSIVLPSIAEQLTIGGILKALDDKIELNRRMNRTLERMAQALFKSWFIDFDPVRAKAEGRDPGLPPDLAALFPDRLIDSDLGPIPEGWDVKLLKDVADVNARSIKSDYQYKHIKYVDISSVNEGTLNDVTSYALEDAPSRAKRLVQTGDTIWSCVRPNRRAFLYIDEPAPNLVVSTGFAVLTPRTVPASYLHQWVTTQAFVEYLTAYATGAAYPAVRADTFEAGKMIRPSDGVLQAFDELVGLLRCRIAQNQRQNRSLAGLRDTLLPKLLTGEIEVPAAEGLVEEVA